MEMQGLWELSSLLEENKPFQKYIVTGIVYLSLSHNIVAAYH